MANNLRLLRTARGWTQAQAAIALGTQLSQYSKLERGERRLSGEWIERAAAAFAVDSGVIVSAADRTLPVLGCVEEAGAVRWLSGGPPASEQRGGLTIMRGALGAMFEGAVLVTACRRISLAKLDNGRVYLVRTADRWLLRNVHASRSSSTWHLIGLGTSPMFDVRIDEAIACDNITF